jgi:hypothetical protein
MQLIHPNVKKKKKKSLEELAYSLTQHAKEGVCMRVWQHKSFACGNSWHQGNKQPNTIDRTTCTSIIRTVFRGSSAVIIILNSTSQATAVNAGSTVVPNY